MKIRSLKGFAALAALSCLALAQGQVVFLELDQLENIYNRVQQGTGLEGGSGATPGQFQTLSAFGSSAPVTGAMPVAAPASDSGTLKIQQIRVGANLYGRFTNYQFGAVLPLPDTDENGVELTDASATDYWNPRPFRESDRLGFYWDDSRNRVIASKGGNYDIVWQRSRAEAGKPADYDSDPSGYHVESGVYYRLYQHSHVGISSGDPILPPNVEADGTTDLAEGDTSYWIAQPYVLRATERYHYSESANAVFATQPGPVNVVWQRLDSSPGDHSGDSSYVEVGGLYYRLYNKRYVISGSPVKEPKKIFWTEGGYEGLPVSIPSSGVSKLSIVYNSDVPKNVPVSEGVPLNEDGGVTTEMSGGGSSVSAITSTLWYSKAQNALRAVNRQGRLFVEFLGAPDSVSGIPEYLGFEVVDIVKEAVPLGEKVDLGDRIPAVVDETDGEELVSRVANLPEGDDFIYRHFASSDTGTAGDIENAILYATRETEHVNDLQLWWLEEGVQGVLWPKSLYRYDLKWPSDVARYQHYLRPFVSTEAEAMETAVELNGQESPQIEYQDNIEGAKAKISPDYRFYSFLTEAAPAHRSLLRFLSGDDIRFERVYSWLDTALVPLDQLSQFEGSDALGESVAAELDSYDPASRTFTWPREDEVPVVFERTVYVGNRLAPPSSAFGGGEEGYWAGYVNLDEGDSISAAAYKDPFVEGFEEANLGAIIPVNAIPNENVLEALWFRRSDDDETDGFSAHYWPAAIGHYTIEWPTESKEIVLASNDGSGPLPSQLAAGRIYYQNDKDQVGYNPNEEHALMQGGQAFALRDDLNVVTNVGGEYSSEPYVLVEYEDADGRPSMATYKVLRESLANNEVFSYPVEAGTILQAPMPLPLLGLPIAESGESEGFNVSKEASWLRIASSLLDESEWDLVVEDLPAVSVGSVYNLQSPDLSETVNLYVTGASYYEGRIRGTVGRAGFELASLSVADSAMSGWGYTSTQDQQPRAYFRITNSMGVVSDLVEGQEYNLYLRNRGRVLRWELASRSGDGAESVLAFTVPEEYYEKTYLVNGASISESEIRRAYDDFAGSSGIGFPISFDTYKELFAVRYEFNDIVFEDLDLILLDHGLEDGALDSWYVSQSALMPEDLILNDYRSKFTFQDRKGNIWVYRGPHDTTGPEPSESFSVQYYYKTLPGFYFPESGDAQPAVGTIVPYLRGREVDGRWSGDATGAENQALAISYQPYWPADVPVLFTGETLVNPKRGLPAVRGQSSAELIYQQSERTTGDRSLALHDPTREKTYLLSSAGLDRVPGSALTESYLGQLFFSQLPPHLGSRFFFDPNRGTMGALVYRGAFVDETLGEDYLMLNLLSESDRETLKALVVEDDPDKAAWDVAIDGLQTTLETFVEDETAPGSYVVNTGVNEVKGPGELSEIKDDDTAVDSYALSAVGPGSGFATLLFGNGEAFTPVGDPVAMQIVRVVDDLYQGEVKPVLSSNPLNEMVTLQQVSDFAGAVDDYEFEWRIASPVDGGPPVVTRNERRLLMGDGNWTHLRFPGVFDSALTAADTDESRLATINDGSIVVRERVPFSSVEENVSSGEYEFVTDAAALAGAWDEYYMSDESGGRIHVRSTGNASGSLLTVEALDEDASGFAPLALEEFGGSEIPSSIVYREFTTDPTQAFSALYLSLDLDEALGARAFVNDVEVISANMRRLDPSLSDSSTVGAPADFQTLSRVYSLPVEALALGQEGEGEWTHRIAVELYSNVDAAVAQEFNARLEAYERTDLTAENWLALDESKYPDGVRTVLGQTADVRALADNYLIMRYRPKLQESGAAWEDEESGFSLWTAPALAEGWIKRVLAGINPFNQRVTDLFSNNVDTDASILTEAGARWEGDVALNLDTINDYGLIEIYETVLNRGRMLSIDAGINYGPANDALLLVAGYLNDLYRLLGDEAKSDALNPTIGIGTADSTYGEVATSLFSFGGQVSSLLDEELALWRGRSDFLQPGVEIAPVYNRLVWNYTRGIDSGEVVYALNYNVKERQDGDLDGKIDAADAADMYPQGHGDAYGHYLTSLKNYYKLFLDHDFTWVPRSEAVNILGVPVSVDYEDERKFATSAVELAKAGMQIMELTWRQDFEDVKKVGWSHLGASRTNERRSLPTTRYWGVDHWASRSQQGAYLNWVVGNAMLPEEDLDPSHEGIQKVDRSTVLELEELAQFSKSLRTSLDNAEGGLNPLGFDQDSLVFDLDPKGFGEGERTHFEQVFERAKGTLRNAVIAFDDAKDVTRLMRSEEDSLSDFQAKVNAQELSYRNQLIELYGTPYPDDIGPGKTFDSGYDGPDLVHYQYIDNNVLDFNGAFSNDEDISYTLDVVATPGGEGAWAADGLSQRLEDGTGSFEYNLTATGLLKKPDGWLGKRQYAGQLQLSVNNIQLKRNAVYREIEKYKTYEYLFDRQLEIFLAKVQTMSDIKAYNEEIREYNKRVKITKAATEIVTRGLGIVIENMKDGEEIAITSVPTELIVGLASGGDVSAPIRGTIKGVSKAGTNVVKGIKIAAELAGRATEAVWESQANGVRYDDIVPAEILKEETEGVFATDAALQDLIGQIWPINEAIQEWEKAKMEYQALVAKGLAVQSEREVFRKRSAAVIQGYRTRNAAFRLFRNEKLERYKALFDLASRYSYLAAQAYDYETGLLGSDEGKDFIARIVAARSLGVVQDGEPQFGGSDQGDPGLSSILAEMAGDWSVLRSRLGYNNPDVYGTTFSLRGENFRIVPGEEGDEKWEDVLAASRVSNLLADPDVARYAMQIDDGSGLPVPGIILEFKTTISNGLNFMGKDLAAGDHAYSPTSFATKIYSAGIVLDGYKGMDNPSQNLGTTQGSESPSDPDLSFLDEDALAATPYLYLIPVGVDVMRTPPLGDQSDLRAWSVNDVTIPLPFNIGDSEHSTKAFYQTSDSLAEPLFAIRKHQAFRPVSDSSVYDGDNGRLFASEFTNSRLIGRSVWNTKWKIVIPGRTLLSDPNEGLERFIDTVKDIRIHLESYSYSGN